MKSDILIPQVHNAMLCDVIPRYGGYARTMIVFTRLPVAIGYRGQLSNVVTNASSDDALSARLAVMIVLGNAYMWL